MSGEPPGEELAEGAQIGPYRLLGLLGRGGMGEVYRAERADGVFAQRVALKLVKRGMDSAEILRRFHRERQILAGLEHPGIARILDGGTAPDGRPYFVIELVEGATILDHCRRAGSSLEDRLRLLIAACEAVDAAHRNLIVHRDLKPSNLLVDATGQIKLLDFGIAKLLEEEPGETATQQGLRLLTPSHAAPEQLLGEPVTMATDVYALGVILYELLTGCLPHPDGGRRPGALRNEHVSVERPSTVLRRATEPALRRFARRVRGDLDTVVLTALHQDPARRYRDAADLARDLRRFLEGRPVQARPDSVLYRGRKLVLRHKLAAAALTLAATSLVGGLGFSLRETGRAQAQARRAERVQELLVSVFREADAETGQGPNLTAREILAAGARRVETELAPEPAIRAELLDAIAQIQRSLGLFEPALQTARTSLADRRKLFGPDSPEVALSLATQAEVVASTGRFDEALRLAEQARPAVERRFGPESPEGQRLTRLHAILLNSKGDTEAALAVAQEMAESARRRFGPASLETARRLIVVATILADFSRFDEAERMTREGLAVLDVSPAATRFERGEARRLLGTLYVYLSRREESLAQFATALELQTAALGPDHVEVALTLLPYGYMLSEMRRFPEADQALRRAIRILESTDHWELGTAQTYLGFSLMGQERYADAVELFIEIEAFRRRRLGDDHALVWGARLSQGLARLRLGQAEEADRLLSEVTDHFERTRPDRDETRSALKFLAEARRLRGRPAEALSMHRKVLDVELKLFGPQHPGVAVTHYNIAEDLLDLGAPRDLAEARQEIDQAITILRHVDAEHPVLDTFLVTSGQIALAAGDHTLARRDLTTAVSRLRERRGAEASSTREAESLLRRASHQVPQKVRYARSRSAGGSAKRSNSGRASYGFDSTVINSSKGEKSPSSTAARIIAST